MHLNYRNVNDAFVDLVKMFHNQPNGLVVCTESRNGRVLQITQPVTITYQRPWERVLFNLARDCNPFFHMYESLWMLAGRNDVESVAKFVSRMREYTDDGKTLNGAYGYRWRNYFGYDQLGWIIDELENNPTTRRCVLQMWDGGRTVDFRGDEPNDIHTEAPEALEFSGDLYKAINGWKDVPCNVCVMFMVNHGNLDMTVMNRSNDLIWGCLGANYVHFSMLHEYVSRCAGLPQGKYNQISNNLHVYVNEHWSPEDFIDYSEDDIYPTTFHTGMPILTDQKDFDKELEIMVDGPIMEERTYSQPFLSTVVKPMMLAWACHKAREYEESLEWANKIAVTDWKRACQTWINMRKKSWEERNKNKENEFTDS